jgi:uncharacterized C2H2 Zn-finger protein
MITKAPTLVNFTQSLDMCNDRLFHCHHCDAVFNERKNLVVTVQKFILVLSLYTKLNKRLEKNRALNRQALKRA